MTFFNKSIDVNPMTFTFIALKITITKESKLIIGDDSNPINPLAVGKEI